MWPREARGLGNQWSEVKGEDLVERGKRVVLLK
jgi:hypothetical protein